eukprot:TRINITY_DN855_c0_g2_i3.p1 TRINITY_DN855_c0_g2~~TRINITY_DN855_c0_g2_i3.p1  ORF type:complete len:262 (-),score=33.50 TRINITY_DN855_c0_g2_i3:317-1102(-)
MIQYIVVLSLVSIVFSQTLPLEVEALKALYNSTNGANWRVKWDLTTDPCATAWIGIKCNPIGNNQYTISNVILQGFNMVGTIPTEIGYLSNLLFFYLSSNFLAGTIPDELGNLHQLVQFGFDKNRLTGGFPDLSHLGGLQTVYLQDNELSGPLDPWGNVPFLQYLFLSRNKLTGTIPNSLAQIYNLQQIAVDFNQLEGTIPAGFGVQENVFQSFYGQNNSFSGPFPNNLCKIAACDLSGGSNLFNCPLPTPNCCHVATCKS